MLQYMHMLTSGKLFFNARIFSKRLFMNALSPTWYPFALSCLIVNNDSIIPIVLYFHLHLEIVIQFNVMHFDRKIYCYVR
jgi:hypothetical protein